MFGTSVQCFFPTCQASYRGFRIIQKLLQERKITSSKREVRVRGIELPKVKLQNNSKCI